MGKDSHPAQVLAERIIWMAEAYLARPVYGTFWSNVMIDIAANDDSSIPEKVEKLGGRDFVANFICQLLAFSRQKRLKGGS